MADFEGEYLGGITDAFLGEDASSALSEELLNLPLFEEGAFGAFDSAYLEPAACPVPPPSYIPVSQRKIVGNHGGDLLRLTGTFPIGTPVEVWIGPVGGPYEYPAYGGEGYGYLPRSVDGVSLSFVLPPVPFVGDFAIRVVLPPSIELIVQAGTFVERTWYGKVHAMRSNFPPQAETGPRRLDAEPPLVS